MINDPRPLLLGMGIAVSQGVKWASVLCLSGTYGDLLLQPQVAVFKTQVLHV